MLHHQPRHHQGTPLRNCSCRPLSSAASGGCPPSPLILQHQARHHQRLPPVYEPWPRGTQVRTHPLPQTCRGRYTRSIREADGHEMTRRGIRDSSRASSASVGGSGGTTSAHVPPAAPLQTAAASSRRRRPALTWTPPPLSRPPHRRSLEQTRQRGCCTGGGKGISVWAGASGGQDDGHAGHRSPLNSRAQQGRFCRHRFETPLPHTQTAE